MIVGVENSSWNNIGDGFYQFSLLRLLEREFPDHSIRMFDAPARRSFKASGVDQDRIFDTRFDLEVDVMVFSGPIFGAHFMRDYAPLIRRQVARGGRFMFVSVHGDGSSASEITEFLREYPPMLLATRDSATFERYTSPKYASYDGVCTASLVSITCADDVVDTCAEAPFVTASFYEGYEPEFHILYDDDGGVRSVSGLEGWSRHKRWRVMRHLEQFRKYPASVDGMRIVRPVHDISYPFNHLSFARDNSVLSYNPFVYLSLYKSTTLTVSNRLHAALPTISFGKPAAYIGATPRNGALERLGLHNHQGGLLRIGRDVLDNEYALLVSAIRAAGL
ncbi:polysaccharide pyruvyl transferase family protein [Demequina rhizosphaerae]|uniref:polysaccharide pyruvyl transferase family protein n=1 Tax=Demequina rhizosphaerae TaxID=1638985 RepID=UPI000783186D|nr:polysaccharide pyruvyl transferase family protein [Demequina rhizosphaerae]